MSLMVLVPVGAFLLGDPERRDLDESARRSAPGRFARLTDGYTHYELEGPPQGQAVVLAAGYSVPYYIWDPTFKALVDAGFRVLRYDYFGRGYSDRPDIAYTQTMYVKQLAELLDAVHMPAPIDLVGLSFGGSIITTFADRYPDRVRSLVYMDPAFRMPGPLPVFAFTPAVWGFFTVIFEERAWADEQLADFLHPDRFPDWPERYREQMQFKGFRRARLSEIVNNAAADQDEELKRVGAHPRRVLVIWGREDKNVPLDLSEYLLKSVSRARLVAVDEAGHLPHWEQPVVVNKALLAFLRP